MLFVIYLAAQSYPWFVNTFWPRLLSIGQTLYRRSMNYCFPEARPPRSFHSASWMKHNNDEIHSWRLPHGYRRHESEKVRCMHMPTTERLGERYYPMRNISPSSKSPTEFILGEQKPGNTVRVAVNGQPLFIIKTEKKE